MAFVENLTHWSLVPPPLNYLANSKISFPTRTDVEEGLCCPDDQMLFLTASMSFLQKQLMRRLSCDSIGEKNNIRSKTYSNLLILENNSKSKQSKNYLKLKDIDRYDQVLRSEASIPITALSIQQILPQPKKSKTIFKLLQKMTTNNEKKCLTDKSESTYNLFGNRGDESNDCVQTVWTSQILELQKSSNLLQDNPSTSSNDCRIALSSLAVNRMAMVSNFKRPNEHACKNPENSQSCNSEIAIEENISKVNILTKSGAQTKLEQVCDLNEDTDSESEITTKMSSTDVSANVNSAFYIKNFDK